MALAKEAIELGGRLTVVSAFTGLPRFLLNNLFGDPDAPGTIPGRKPRSAHWYLNRTVVVEIQSAFFYACFRSIRTLGYPPSDALVASYKHYLRHFGHDPRLTFDRAFDLVGHVEGLWTSAPPRLTTTICRRCRAAYLVLCTDEPIGSGGCPFCRFERPLSGQTRKALSPPAGGTT
jgi:hypothetical protein